MPSIYEVRSQIQVWDFRYSKSSVEKILGKILGKSDFKTVFSEKKRKYRFNQVYDVKKSLDNPRKIFIKEKYPDEGQQAKCQICLNLHFMG